MSKATIKAVIKHLANAPAIAAARVLDELPTEAERDEARRIFAAVGITPAEAEKKTPKGDPKK